MAKPRVKVPKSAAAGDIITIKTLISHKMESGQRKGKDGKVIPRNIINKFECMFNGKPVMSCEIEPAVSANPYIEFDAKVAEAGKFEFKWTDDDGKVIETSSEIAIK